MAALQDGRERTKRVIAGLPETAIDTISPGQKNSIGTLLYHIAAIEMDWLFVEVLEQGFSPEVVALFPFDVRDADGRLTPVHGVGLEAHVARLDASRAILMRVFQGMTREDLHRPRSLPQYDVSPAWVLHHLVLHEAEHRGQMVTMREAVV